jgi:alanine racemase
VGDADLMAVVKADAYGHGAVEVSRAVLDAGAAWLGVAMVEEGVALREAGIDAPVLVLSEPPLEAAEAVVAHRLTPVVYRESWVEALAEAVAYAGRGGGRGSGKQRGPLGVHLKVDTGMHRAGCDGAEALRVAKAVAARDELTLEGLMTHLAVADEPDHPATEDQLACFEGVRAELRRAGFDPAIVHASNSAAALTRPEARYGLVRCGIALYGIPPSPALSGTIEGAAALVPAMSLLARVSQVRRVAAGEGVSYGLRYRLEYPSTIATVPVGYGDGVPRRLGQVGGEVLVGGRRRTIAGTITMDQLMVDCGDAPSSEALSSNDGVEVGDEVVLIGVQGTEEITATEWAERLDTIAYEITCGVGARVPREYVG